MASENKPTCHPRHQCEKRSVIKLGIAVGCSCVPFQSSPSNHEGFTGGHVYPEVAQNEAYGKRPAGKPIAGIERGRRLSSQHRGYHQRIPRGGRSRSPKWVTVQSVRRHRSFSQPIISPKDLILFNALTAAPSHNKICHTGISSSRNDSVFNGTRDVQDSQNRSDPESCVSSAQSLALQGSTGMALLGGGQGQTKQSYDLTSPNQKTLVRQESVAQLPTENVIIPPFTIKATAEWKYLQKPSSFPKNSRIFAELSDVALQDAPSTQIAKICRPATQEDLDKGIVLRFTVDKHLEQRDHWYAVSARVSMGPKTSIDDGIKEGDWHTDTLHFVELSNAKTNDEVKVGIELVPYPLPTDAEGMPLPRDENRSIPPESKRY